MKAIDQLTDEEARHELARIYDLPRDVCERVPLAKVLSDLATADALGFDGTRGMRGGDQRTKGPT